MAKITRAIQKIFCGDVPAIDNVAVFGSLAASSPDYSDDPIEIQSLAAYGQGWESATVLNQAPALQDMNALQYLFSRQIAYQMQAGIPEWIATQTYYIGSWAISSAGIPYVSIVDNNLNNALTDATKWTPGLLKSVSGLTAALELPYGIGNVSTRGTYSPTVLVSTDIPIDCRNSNTFSYTYRASATRNIPVWYLGDGQSINVMVTGVANDVISFSCFSAGGTGTVTSKIPLYNSMVMLTTQSVFTITRVVNGANNWAIISPLHGIS